MKPGRERTKAWIYSVINPVLDGLRIEASFLARRNWTFRRYNRDLEFIRPTGAFVGYQSHPNFDDFRSSNPMVREKLDHRDARREELRKSCDAAFEYLVEIPGFQQKVSECFDVFVAEAPREASHLEGTAAKLYEVVAELIVNNVRELPHHYGHHKFWSRFSEEFLSLRTGSALEQADQAGLELKKSNDDLSIELLKERSDLASKYDIPWALYTDESMSLPGR